MRILLVSAMFPPIRTGTSYYSQNLAAALSTRGHHVTLVTLSNEGSYDIGLDFDVIRMPAIHIPLRNYFKHFRISSIHLDNFASVRKIARERQIDVIVLVNHYLDIAFPAIYAARSNQIPLVCSVGTQLQSPSKIRHRFLNLLDRLICGRLIFPFCSRIVAWDQEILRYLKDVHGPKIAEKCEIINYGVNGDPQRFTSHQHDYSAHHQILGVGAVIEQRDFLSLVQAFEILAPEFPQLRLRIIGHVYHDAALKYAAGCGLGNRILFRGEQPHDKVLEALKSSDLFFSSLTSRYIGLGTATIESMLMGVPTLVNAYPGLLGKASLRDGEDIMLLDTLSPTLIADRMRRLLLDPALRSTIGQGGRNFVMQHLNWETVAADYEHLLRSVIRP